MDFKRGLTMAEEPVEEPVLFLGFRTDTRESDVQILGTLVECLPLGFHDDR